MYFFLFFIPKISECAVYMYVFPCEQHSFVCCTYLFAMEVYILTDFWTQHLQSDLFGK